MLKKKDSVLETSFWLCLRLGSKANVTHVCVCVWCGVEGDADVMQYEQKEEAYRVEALLVGMMTKCFDRCVTPNLMSEKELTSPEAKCIDNCTWKYLQIFSAHQAAIGRVGVLPSGMPDLSKPAGGKR